MTEMSQRKKNGCKYRKAKYPNHLKHIVTPTSLVHSAGNSDNVLAFV